MSVADLKSTLFNSCVQYAERRIATAREAFNTAQQASNEESKSTAGDKHDTSRAMMQIEAEQAAKQLTEAEKLKDELGRLDLSEKSDVMLGSVVKTSSGNYFVAISAGKIEAGTEIYFAVSISSPIAQAMKGLKKNDKYVFNGKSVSITEVI